MCALWKTGITEDDLLENLDTADLEDHATALGEALSLSFPKKSREAVKAVESQNETTVTPGIYSGEPGIRPPLSLDEQMSSSGT